MAILDQSVNKTPAPKLLELDPIAAPSISNSQQKTASIDAYNNPSMKKPPALLDMPGAVMNSAANKVASNAGRSLSLAPRGAGHMGPALSLAPLAVNSIAEKGLVGTGKALATGAANAASATDKGATNLMDNYVGPGIDKALFGNQGRPIPEMPATSPAKVAQNGLTVTPQTSENKASWDGAANRQENKSGWDAMTPQSTKTQVAGMNGQVPADSAVQAFKNKVDSGELKNAGYVSMPGNPGHQPEVWQDDKGFHTNAMQGPAGKTTRPDLGIEGYDTSGKPFFKRTDPATYTIENGKVSKYDQNGQPLQLNGFASGADNGKGVDFGMTKEQRDALPAGNSFSSDAMAKLELNGVSASDRLAALNYLNRDRSSQLADDMGKNRYLDETGLAGNVQDENGVYKNPVPGALATNIASQIYKTDQETARNSAANALELTKLNQQANIEGDKLKQKQTAEQYRTQLELSKLRQPIMGDVPILDDKGNPVIDADGGYKYRKGLIDPNTGEQIYSPQEYRDQLGAMDPRLPSAFDEALMDKEEPRAAFLKVLDMWRAGNAKQ